MSQNTEHEVKEFSIIGALKEKNKSFYLCDEFNYASARGNSSKKGLAHISVAIFNGSKGPIQFISVKDKLILIDEIGKKIGVESIVLNREFSPKEAMPVGKSIDLQPLLPEQNISTFLDSRIFDYQFVELVDAVQEKKIVLLTEILAEILCAQIVKLENYEQDIKTSPSHGIKVSRDMDVISKSMEESMYGGMNITGERQLHKIQDTLKSRKLFYPIFPRTSEEILIMSESDEHIKTSEIYALLDIDFMLCGAFLVNVFNKHPELSRASLSLKDIIHAVGELESFSIIKNIASASRNADIADNISQLYLNLASLLNVCSQVSFDISEYLLDSNERIFSPVSNELIDSKKALLLSRLLNFPLLLMVANLTGPEYDKFIDHAIINPSKNSMVLADAVLGFNETDFIIGILGKNENIPSYMLKTFREQYSPFYNNTEHLYPNLMFIVSSIISHQKIMISSVITDNLNLVIGKAKQIGISEQSIHSVMLNASNVYKKKAIDRIGFHNKKSPITKDKITSYKSKFTTVIF